MARTINGIPMPEITQQDTIDDTALIPITNKDGRVRNISFATLKTGITKGGVSAQKNLDPSLPVGLIDIQNDNIDLASVVSGKLTLDISKLPTNVPIASVKYVRDKSDLAGALSSSVVYIVDGIIDMGSVSIEIPAGGLNITGFNPNVSGLFTSTASSTLFTSPVDGSGDLFLENLLIQASGTGAKVYDIKDSDSSHAVEVLSCIYNNCTSLGSIENYRQGLEDNTARFGGTPELTLVGNWLGGFRATTTIVRGLDSGMSGSLFKAGAGFTMASRFLTDMNADLPANCSLADFSPSNFVLPSTVQIQGAIITKATGVDVMPNLTEADLVCDWRNNIGLNNTHVGGETIITASAATVISATSTFYDLAGTFAASDLQHFDAPANGQLRHLGLNPVDYKINASISLDGSANNEITLKVVKWDDSASTFVDITSQTKPINNLLGGGDQGYFDIIKSVRLEQNDYVKLQVSNNTGTDNVTAQVDSFYEISER